MRPLVAVAVATAALAAPVAASAATLYVDPVKSCYREQRTVFLRGEGYTPNAFVEFTREGEVIASVQADASGGIQGNLRLPGLLSGQRRLTYVGTDTQDPARTAQVSLLTTATDVRVRPMSGAPHRRLRIMGRGFFGRSRTVWAHVTRIKRRGRRGEASARARTVKIGRVEGACRKVTVRRRLFRRNAAPGRYRVQFDTFRRYRSERRIEYDGLLVKILSPASAP
jgi:hypothetical protein